MASENTSSALTETVSKPGRPQNTKDDYHSVIENSEEEDRNFPEGVTYPLNLKRLVVGQLRRLTTMLGLLRDKTVAILRQVVEGKLVEQGYEPRNIQVVVVNKDSRLYLVNEAGMVKEAHVSVRSHILFDASLKMKFP